jgi:hypothetical protein
MVNPGMTVGTVKPGFVGLSFEKSHMTDGFFTPRNAALIALFKLLGPSVLRIGANDADRTNWSPGATPVAGPPFPTTVGTVEVDDLAAFLDATAWKVIYAVNFKTGTPTNSAAEAAYVASKVSAAHLYGFEIGNEINLGATASSGGYPAVKAQWETFASAIRGAVPNAPLIGPATNPGGLQNYAVPFAHDEARELLLMTHHYYRGSGADPSSTMGKLLSPDPGLVSVLKTLSTAAMSNNIPDGFRLGECASFYSHGAPGVSNAFGSALWVLDFLFDNAKNGSSGVNVHGGRTGMDGTKPFYYAPILEDGTIMGVNPIFYGMLMMTTAGPGNVLSTTASAGSLNFTANAIATGEGAMNVILDNKDATSGVVANVDTGLAVQSASAIYLDGPSLDATSGARLAGAGVSAMGTWNPNPPYALPSTGHIVTVTVPPASAALVHVR